MQNGRLLKATQTRNWILGLAILLFIITGLLINNSMIKQRTNLKLQVQRQEIQNKNLSLEHLVKEKEWLMKEIHHRVKNNFHTVIGLLGTQAGYLKSEEAIDAMAESQQRIQAMSLIHQKLYQSENMSDVDMSHYIHELVDYLQDSLTTGRRIRFHFELDNISLGVSHAVPIGLILNEAITNAVKHAFPKNREGNIRISFKRADDNDNKVVLTIRDDGAGLPDGFVGSNDTMGMNLMQGLAMDIDGKFSIESNGGTAVKVEFIYDRDLPKNNPTNMNETF